MQKFLESDGGNPDGTAKDGEIGVTAGTKYKAKVFNDNFFNIFEFVEGAGYSLIDDDLEQLTKAMKGKYVATYTYNTSSIATQTVNDIVEGSDGGFYRVLANAVNGDNPVGSTTGNWESYQVYKTGKKSLLTNGSKLFTQRDVTGGRKQVVLNTRNLGGKATISFTGTALVTIKEAATLGASDALTSWDIALATNVLSGTTITLTANKYIHVEFSTTVFSFALLEYGSVVTNYPILEDTIDECLPFFRRLKGLSAFCNVFVRNATQLTGSVPHPTEMRVPPVVNTNITESVVYCSAEVGGSDFGNLAINISGGSNTNKFSTAINASNGGLAMTAGQGGMLRLVNSAAYLDFNAEIFNADEGVGITYKEDRWYV